MPSHLSIASDLAVRSDDSVGPSSGQSAARILLVSLELHLGGSLTLIDLYRRYVPRRLNSLLKGSVGHIQRRVESGMQLPRLPIRNTVRGAVWGISMMRDEQDVAGATVRHMLDQGLAGVIVADNLSCDGTADAIRAVCPGPPVYVVNDREPAYFQAEKISYLAHLAWRAGADWIVPFDADEHWYAPETNISSYLNAKRADVVRALMHDVLPASANAGGINFGDDEMVAVRSLYGIEPKVEMMKVAFRAQSGTHVLTGNHEIAHPGLREGGLHLLHYQWRGAAQYLRKIRQGAQAVRLAELVEGMAWHWRALDELDDAALLRSWEDLCATTASVESDEWTSVKAPWRNWRSWDPDSVIRS